MWITTYSYSYSYSYNTITRQQIAQIHWNWTFLWKTSWLLFDHRILKHSKYPSHKETVSSQFFYCRMRCKSWIYQLIQSIAIAPKCDASLSFMMFLKYMFRQILLACIINVCYQCINDKINCIKHIPFTVDIHSDFFSLLASLNFACLLYVFYFGTLSSLYMPVSAWCLVLNLLSTLVIGIYCFFYFIETVIILKGLSFPSYVIGRVWKKDGMMGEA